MDKKETKLVPRGPSAESDDTQPIGQIPPISADMTEDSSIPKAFGSTIIPLHEDNADNLHLRIHIQRAHMLFLAHRERKIA